MQITTKPLPKIGEEWIEAATNVVSFLSCMSQTPANPALMQLWRDTVLFLRKGLLNHDCMMVQGLLINDCQPLANLS